MSASKKTDFINANLSVRLQHLLMLASISSNQALDKLEDEIKLVLADGITAVEIKEAIYHSGAYCGFTRDVALDKTDGILKALSEDVAYKIRIFAYSARPVIMRRRPLNPLYSLRLICIKLTLVYSPH